MKSLLPQRAALLFLLAATMCLCANAWPFWGGGKPQEKVVAKLDKAKSKDFQRAVTLRQMRSEELRVLSRLVEEKNGELKGFDSELRTMFAMSDDALYSYNSTNRTLYLISTNVADGATADVPALVPHHVFPNDDDAGDFLRTLSAKQITRRQIETFREVIREKRDEYRLTDKYLADKYGIKADRKYRFDDKTGELFEEVPNSPPPSKTSSKTSSKSSSSTERTKQ